MTDIRFQSFEDGELADIWYALADASARHPGHFFGLANAILKPILALLTLPIIIFTLGIAYFFLNVLMLLIAEWVTPDFSIDGFWTYVGATIVVWLVNVTVGWVLDRVRE